MSRETIRPPSAVDRRFALLSLAAFGGLAAMGRPTPLLAQADSASGRLAAVDLDIDQAIRAQLSRDPALMVAGMRAIENYNKLDIIPSLIFALRFVPGPVHGSLVRELQRLSGEGGVESWFDWMLWQEAQAGLVPHPSYFAFKRDVFLSIDPNFAAFLDLKFLGRDAAKIRFEEVTWGGVRKDGILSLDFAAVQGDKLPGDPQMLAADQAGYLRGDDLVFGVSINGDTQAFPLRIMGWHEMFNSVIGGVPVALAYCTLCGAGFLFKTEVPGRQSPFVFGSSGFLYRSNKLMFDRETHSLWNQYTGKPVIGPLAGSEIALEQLPVAIAPWSEWRKANPNTTVLSVDTGHRRDYGSGVVYNQYFSSPELMFPALVDQQRLAQKDFVFGVQTLGAARAWPVSAFKGGRLINDRVGGLSLVLIGDAAGRTVRAYDRGDRAFALDDRGRIVSEGKIWRRTEDALIGPSGEQAPRVAGQLSYWFAWSGYLGGAATLYPG